MRKIKITQGYTAYISDEDYERVSQHRWYISKTKYKDAIKYYAATGIWDKELKKNKQVSMHRFILGLSDPKIEADHIDGNGLNNQRNNLRSCSSTKNKHNMSKRQGKTSSIYKGVQWSKQANKWISNIFINKKRLHLGFFIIERDAAIAYNNAALKYFGEFARINKLPALKIKTKIIPEILDYII